MRLIAFVPLVALLALVGVSVFLLTREGERERFTEGMVGQPAPAYALARLDGGEPLTGDARRGRAYVVNLFASWCTPCRAEHPLLMTMAGRGVEIVGVAYKDQPANTARYLDELGNPYREVGLDLDGQFSLQLGTAGVPETFVVSAAGRIVAVHRGPLTPDIIAQEIEPALRAR